MAGYTQWLRSRGADGLATLLRLRPDLAAPAPATLRSLAARATTRVSLDRVLAGVDGLLLQCLESVLALDGTAGRDGGVSAFEVAAAVGLEPGQVTTALTQGLDLGLLWQDAPDGAAGPDDAPAHLRPAPGVADALGPYPAGLGPVLQQTLARRSAQGLERLAAALGVDLPEHTPADDDPVQPTSADADAVAAAAAAVGRVARHLALPATVETLLGSAPPGARQVLDALTWGPPVGRSPENRPGQPTPARTAVEWLLRHGLLSVQDAQHVVLPREVALALRGGLTHRSPATAPAPERSPVSRRTVDADSALHAEEITRLVGGLVTLWGDEPAAILRTGGLGVRELRRVANRLDVTEAVAALVVEVAAAAGLVIDDGEDPPALAPTSDGEEWLVDPVPERWQVLAQSWLAAESAAWLVGSRDERGSVRAALDPESRRPWAPRLRRTVLEVLADAPAQVDPDSAPVLTAAQVHEVLAWRSPRSAPAEHAVEAVMTEAGLLGVLGAGGLSSAGLALLRRAALGPADPTDLGPADALAAQLPPAVDDVLLQGDLTGIVPGRPSPALGALLEMSADVESRGAGLTVRFTATSVRRALDTGRTAEQLLAALSQHARSGVPQPLEYLVLDAARRHGQVRVGMASSYLRSDDPHLLAGLVEDRALRSLGLLQLAPTVIAAQATPAALVAALRERGLAPVTEDPSGQVLVTGPQRHVVRRPRGRRTARPVSAPAAPPALTAEEARDRRLRRLATDLLKADGREIGGAGARDDDGTQADGAWAGATTGTPDPVLALAILREAVTEGREVWIEIVDPSGGLQRRRVRPLRVDSGRVRAVDAEREAELTVAVHRIASVTPTSGD